jgi:predicted DNA-binding transcriptional regulator AlpA
MTRTRKPTVAEVPPLVGLAEAADVVGLTKRRIQQLQAEGQFPEPVTRLRATPVWRRDDLVAWAARRDPR